MKLIKLGDYVELVDNRNSELLYGIDDVRGISTLKCFIKSKASLDNVSLHNYKIVDTSEFAYVSDTSRRGDKIGLAFQDENPCIISSIYTVFRIKSPKTINPYYLMMYFKRLEFDRYARFNSWGSARETFSWEDFCDIKMTLPDIKIQEKYVKIYNSMKKNLQVCESKLEDLKLVCDGSIEYFKKNYQCYEISNYIELVTETNAYGNYKLRDVVGVSKEKKIIPTKADASRNDLSKFIVIRPKDFIYNPRNGIAVGLNMANKNYIISWNNTAFRIKEKIIDNIMPEYLFMFLCRSEWDRKVKFDSWGSSTEIYSFESLSETKIPMLEMKKQLAIVNLFKVIEKRKNYAESMRNRINKICSTLIAGAVKEASKIYE